MSRRSHKRNSAQLTFLSADSPAKMSATQGNAKELRRILEADFGLTTHDLLANYDPESHSWKMSPAYSVRTGFESLPTLPAWGMTRNGALYQLPPLVRRTNASGGSAWPTPTAQSPGWKNLEPVDRHGNTPTHINQRFYDRATGRLLQKGLDQVVRLWATPTVNGNNNRKGASSESGDGLSTMAKMWATPCANEKQQQNSQDNHTALSAQVKRWATPNARDGHGAPSPLWARQVSLPKQVTGTLNPSWVEQLMGLPEGWTDIGGPLRPVKNNTNGKPRAPRKKKSRTESTA